MEWTSLFAEIAKAISGTSNTSAQTIGSARRTDQESASVPVVWRSSNASPADCHKDSLKNAAAAVNVPGVYILRLNGVLLKVGSAEIGVRKRMQQYYGMNPYCGLPQITKNNRDQITVEWQDCPAGKCIELESKLFRKYGQGIFASRSPHSQADTWDLLI